MRLEDFGFYFDPTLDTTDFFCIGVMKEEWVEEHDPQKVFLFEYEDLLMLPEQENPEDPYS